MNVWECVDIYKCLQVRKLIKEKTHTQKSKQGELFRRFVLAYFDTHIQHIKIETKLYLFKEERNNQFI